MSTEGHNADQALEDYVKKIEILNQEAVDIRNDIKDVKLAAKESGIDIPTMMSMVKLRAMDKETREKKEELRDRYLTSLGLL